MNGRIYDSALGRFLSADPINQDIYHTQTYNAYSYVLNNPLSFTDPTGMQAVIELPPYSFSAPRPPSFGASGSLGATGSTFSGFAPLPPISSQPSNTFANNSFQTFSVNANNRIGPDGVRYADDIVHPIPKKYEELSRKERMAVLAQVIKDAKAQGDRRLAKQAMLAFMAENQLTAEGITSTVIIGIISGGVPALERAVGTQLTKMVAAEKTVDLFRAVGVREFKEVMANGSFKAGGNSLSSRQFALTFEEAMKFADADLSKVAILKATVPERVLGSFHFSKTIDPFIFKSGVITVYPENLTLLNQSLRALEHVF